MREEYDVYVFRHDNVGPKIERLLCSSGVQGFEKPPVGEFALKKRLAFETGERQGMGVEGNIPSFAAFSVMLFVTEVHVESIGQRSCFCKQKHGTRHPAERNIPPLAAFSVRLSVTEVHVESIG